MAYNILNSNRIFPHLNLHDVKRVLTNDVYVFVGG